MHSLAGLAGKVQVLDLSPTGSHEVGLPLNTCAVIHAAPKLLDLPVRPWGAPLACGLIHRKTKDKARQTALRSLISTLVAVTGMCEDTIGWRAVLGRQRPTTVFRGRGTSQRKSGRIECALEPERTKGSGGR